tara:strand:- start:14900 stop:15289 length:390 start_codon:yes stop_codon:yes gene_type:complete
MTKNVITLSVKDNLVTAEELFKKHRIRHIPVVSGDEVIGILSYTDLMRISFADAIDEHEQEVDTMVYNMFTIEQVMAKNVISVTSGTTIQDTAKFLAERDFHALPVIDDGKLVGIVTTTDLIHYLLQQY